MDAISTSLPGWVGAYAETVTEARGDRERVARVLERSLMPVAIVDDERRYIDVNAPARLALGLSLAELQRLQVDDFTPPHLWPVMKANWGRLVETGWVAGPSDVASRDGTNYLGVSFYALANALPGRHLVAIAPVGWPRFNVLSDPERPDSEPVSALTAREVEVLALAAYGRIGPMIAQELVVSAATVRTHFQHIYAKLGVQDRAAAVAKAMRLGLIP